MKKIIIVICLTCFLISSVSAQFFPYSDKGTGYGAIEDARNDVGASARPLVWGINGFLSSCVLAGSTSLIGMYVMPTLLFAFPATSFICCIGSGIGAYFFPGNVPRVNTRGMSSEYRASYINEYKNKMSFEQAKFSLIGGFVGFLITCTLYFLLFAGAGMLSDDSYYY